MHKIRHLALAIGLATNGIAFAASSISLIDYTDYVPQGDLKRVYEVTWFTSGSASPPDCTVSACPSIVTEVVKHVAPNKLLTTTTRIYKLPYGHQKVITKLWQTVSDTRLASFAFSARNVTIWSAGGTDTSGTYTESYVPPYTALSSIELDPLDASSSFYLSHQLGEWSSYHAVKGEQTFVAPDPSTPPPPPIPSEKRISATYSVYGLETVKVPAGTFENCLRLERKTLTNEQIDWLCPGIGLVKRFNSSPSSSYQYEWQLTSHTPL